MCGIAGIAAWRLVDRLREDVESMTDVLAHRGPDDSGFWVDPESGIALGHRRLSIVDVSPAGHQPMLSSSRRYVLAYNGEIYNFLALRTELERAGLAPPWRGHSDTEILLGAVEAWGPTETLSRLVGMFAIALWDRQQKRLLLARDRIGEKPLYYGVLGDRVLFASELKAFRVLEGKRLTIDRRALASFMQSGYVPAPHTIYVGVHKLPPAHFVWLRNLRDAASPQPYWVLEAKPRSTLDSLMSGATDEDAITAVHDRLRDAVGLQMVSDVPLGAFLSGGVDSSLVVSLMQQQCDRPVRTFTIGFDDPRYNEAPYARAVAAHLGTDHTELVVCAADAEALIPELGRIYDEPFADSSQIPTTLVSRLTRRHVTVSLSGDGGDELFAGYPRYAMSAAMWRRMQHLPLPVRRATAKLMQAVSSRTWDRLMAVIAPSQIDQVNGRRIHRLARVLAAEHLSALYSRLLWQWQPEDAVVVGASAHPTPAWPAGDNPLEQLRRYDLATYLPDDLMVKVDRAAMSTSLESRAPLLDHRVVELAFALPDRFLVRAGQGKWVLRQVLDRYVPRSLIERPKAGFSVPLGSWLQGPLRDWAAALLDPGRLRGQGLLHADKVDEAWRQHQTGRADRSTLLWNVLMFQSWADSAGSDVAPLRVP